MPGLSGAGGGSKAIRAGEAYVEVSAQDKKAQEAIARLKSKFSAFGKGMMQVGLGIAAVGAVALAPLAKVMDSLGEQGKIAAAADAFGLTAEEASRLFGIMKSAGSDVRDATEGLITFNQRVSDAMSGTGEEAQKLFEGLGVSAESFTGNTADKFNQLIASLRNVEDPAKRAALLLKAVGEDTGKNLIPLIAMSAEEMKTLGDAFEVSAADMAAAKEATKAYTLAAAQAEKTWREVVLALAPAISAIVQAVLPVIQVIAQFMSHNHKLIATLAGVAAGLVAAGLVVAGLGAAVSSVAGIITAATTIVGGVSAAIAFIATPAGIAVAALAALIAVGAILAYVFWDEILLGLQVLSAWFQGTFSESIAAAQQVWEGLVAALRQGNLELAFQVVGAGVMVVWWDMITNLKNMFMGFLKWLVDRLLMIPKVIAGMFAKIPGMEGVVSKLQAAMNLPGMLLNVADGALSGILKMEMDKAKALLGLVVGVAKAGDVAKAVAAAKKLPDFSPAVRQATAIAEQRGSFSADMARQRFAQGESLERKKQKTQEEIAANTKKGADEAVKLNNNLRVQP